MEITITNTSKMTELNGVPARVWEGKTSTGIKVHCFITRIAVSTKEDPEVHEQFRKELSEQKAPSADLSYIPLKMIL